MALMPAAVAGIFTIMFSASPLKRAAWSTMAAGSR